jgi:hypothetical protein
MAGEELRAEASREEAFDGERTRGLPARPELGRGEPLLRRLGVGICGETLAGAAAGTGAGDSDSDSGGGELKAGLGGSSSSSGGGDLKTGLAGASAFAARAAGTGTGAANFGGSGVDFGGSGTGVGFTSGSGSGGGGGTLRGVEVGAGCAICEAGGTGGADGGTGGGIFPCALWLASQSLASVPAESLALLIRMSIGAVRLRRGTLRSVSAFFLAIVGGRTSA